LLDNSPCGHHPRGMRKPPADFLAISLLLFAGVFTAWIGIAGPLLADDVWTSFWKFVSNYQTLIGATIAAAGILVASRKVTRQLRQGVLAREEDRIERDRARLLDLRRELTANANPNNLDLVGRRFR
jgi:hypothetical protein